MRIRLGSFLSVALTALLASIAQGAAVDPPSPEPDATPPEGYPASPDTLPLYVLEPIQVRSYRPLLIGRAEAEPAALPYRPASDGGDFLRFLPGITAGRMGGHGVEPNIRGQQATRLNVVVDGAYLHGGCPNRMDPPASIAGLETADRVTVLRGVRTVLHGSGGTGGTVLVEHLPPGPKETARVRGSLHGGFESNTEGLPVAGDLLVRREDLYARGSGRRHHAEDYEDGDGNRVRSSFTQVGGEVRLGWRGDRLTPTRDELLEASFTWDRTTDALFAGAGMDSPFSERFGVRLNGVRATGGGTVTGIRGSAYLETVDHEMDNYTLRSASGGYRVARTGSDTMGGRLLADLAGGITAGIDLQRLRQDGTRYGNNSDPGDVTAVQAVLWPDVALTDVGILAEGGRALSERLRLVAGMRFDRVSFTWGSAGEQPTLPTMGMVRSPDDLYAFFYGVRSEDVTENNLGGLVRLEFRASDPLLVHAGVSRTVRTADPTERAIANEMGPRSWVGNPALHPEKHHTLDLGLAWNRASWSASVSTWVDRVDDFILRDSARGQGGILVTLPEADVYRNVRATLAGCELSTAIRPADAWEVAFDAAYTWGENGETHAPLPQIPPLQGTLSLRRTADRWEAGGRVHAAARQTRIDADPATGTGLDVGETPGYAIVDLHAGIRLGGGVSLLGGVANLLDRTWASHLNRENGVDNRVLRVNEPGRSLYARVAVGF